MRKAMAILLSIVLAVSTCGCVTPLTEGEKSPATPSTTTAEGQSSATAGGTSFVDSSEEAVPEEPEVNLEDGDTVSASFRTISGISQGRAVAVQREGASDWSLFVVTQE